MMTTGGETIMHASPRNGFTLIEILIAVMLIGVGMASVIGLVMHGAKEARTISLWAISGPAAQSAAEYAILSGRITATSTTTVDLPIPGEWFESPMSFRVDAASPPGASGIPAPGNSARLVTLRVRTYDNPADRAAEVRQRSVYYVTKLIRALP